MKKTLLFIFLKFLALIVVILLGVSMYENNHNLGEYTSMVGTYTGTDVNDYTVTDRASHIGYLDTASINGNTINYIDRGARDGTPILLVHGTPTNSRLWRKMIPGLVEQGYRVIAPDQFGFGTSDMGSNHDDLTIEKQSQRLIGLMDHLNIETFAIAGHDQGSLWVWETITTAPDRISHLVIMNSIGDRAGFHPPSGFGTANIGTKFTSRAMGSRMLGRIFAYGAMNGGLADKSVATMTMVNGYLFPLFNGMSHTYYDFITHFDEIEQKLAEVQPKFKDLDIPTTIIRGAQDKILVGAEQVPVLTELFDIQPDDIHILPDAAHFIQEEAADEIVEIIGQFIGE